MSNKLSKLAGAVSGSTPSVVDIKGKRNSLEQRLAQAGAQEANTNFPALAEFPTPGTAQVTGSTPETGVQAQVTSIATGYTPYVEGMAIEVGMHLELPRTLLAKNPMNPRVNYEESDVADMSNSLARNGQMQAVQVYPPLQPGDPFMVKEGHTRDIAAGRLGWKTLKVEVVPRPSNPIEDYRQARELNKRRNTITVFDDADRFAKLIELTPGITGKELAALLDENPTYVSKALVIGELPQSLRDRMQDQKETFGIAMAYGVATYFRKCGAEDTDDLVEQICAGEISSKKLQYMLSDKKQASTGPNRRARPIRRTEVKSGGKGELKLFPQGRLEVKLMLADRKHERQLFEKIREVFVEHGLTFADAEDSPQT